MSRHARHDLAADRQDERQELNVAAGQASTMHVLRGASAAPAHKPMGAITYTITKGADVWSFLPHWMRKQPG